MQRYFGGRPKGMRNLLTLASISEEAQEDAGTARLHLPVWLSGVWETLVYGPLLVCWVN